MIARKQKGFTLVELMMAMAFFSFILLFITTGFVIVSRAYNKGLTVKLIQDEGRSIVEELTREIRVSSSDDINVAVDDCISVSGSLYYLYKPASSTPPYDLYKVQDGSTCDSYDETVITGERVLADRVSVQFMDASELSSTGVYSLKIVLSTNDTTLITASGEGAECTTDNGGQYCDVVTMSTVISTR